MIIIKISLLVAIGVSTLIFCIDMVNSYLDNRDMQKIQRIINNKKF